MALTKTLPASALTQAVSTTCKPKTCPTCGSQECFERPRFFCGQLLTDKDLDAAQRYVIEKNKLHNRYLVGSGVVCGLAVRCDPCDGSVVIEPGYAIDCCGNDIVVCEAQRFDVAEYIKRCCREAEDACEGKLQPPPSFCDDLPKEYCLVISYNELHTHPVTAMTRGNGCSTNRCEPSRTSEVFRFDLICESDDRRGAPADDFWGKARECLADFLTTSKKFFADLRDATQQQNHTALMTLFCRLREDVLRHNRKGPHVRCTLKEELQLIEDQFPKVTEIANYNALVYHAMFRMYGWLLQLTIDCICDALLVPCTQCGDEEGVLLACMTVRNGKVEKICNTARKQVLTGPALRYWLQPLYRSIGNLIDQICCELNLADMFDSIFRPVPPRSTGTFTGAGDAPQATGGEPQETVLAGGMERMTMRAAVALNLAQDYSPANQRSLRIANFMQFADPNVVTALDLYQLTGYEASQKLLAIGCTVSERRAANEAEAYALGNLFEMAWVIEPQSKVQLLTVAPDDRVTGIRIR